MRLGGWRGSCEGCRPKIVTIILKHGWDLSPFFSYVLVGVLLFSGVDTLQECIPDERPGYHDLNVLDIEEV